MASGSHSQTSFDVSRYAGQWFEIYRSKNIPFEKGTDITATYTINENDGSVAVVNKEWLPQKKQWNQATGTASVDDPSVPAQLTVRFFRFLPGGNYQVMKTDYDNFSVVLSDNSWFFGFYRRKYAWILARQPALPEPTVTECFNILQSVGLEKNDFVKTSHGEAPKL